MFQKIFSHIHLQHRHFWRHLKMSEMARIYISMMLRNLAVALTGIFVCVYMLELGYSFLDICWLMVCYYGIRVLGTDLLAGAATAYIGPKRTMSIGFVVTALSSALFAMQPVYHFPVWLLGAIYGSSHSFVFIALHTEFSKIHKKAHEGSQLGYLSAIEKLGGVLGPLIGGVLATLFGGQYIFVVGLVLMILAGIPILRSPETVPTKRKLNLRSVKFKSMRRSALVYAISGVEIDRSGIWSIYVAMFVLTSGTVYMGVSLLHSLSVVAAMVAAVAIGHLVDKKYGRKLLRFGAIAAAILHVFRLFINRYIPALALNIGYEVAKTANHIPISKGFYDDGDIDGDGRIAYMVIMGYIDSTLKCLAWVVLVPVVVLWGDLAGIQVGFMMGAACALFTMTEHYKALD
ncbi:MAG: MFS transporter [Candidatus Nomurabacteria bacterium]|jgi:MFS family permease|nr:MFS transporter [Candidatus Nomurabacteria bacterium]